MALQALWAPETQFQNKNGSILVNGKIYIQYRGRSQLARTYRDPDGTYTNPNPLLTDNDGRVLCFADDSFSYTAVVCDFYGNELFSFDPIPCGSGSSGSDGSSAQHWIGINAQTQQVSRNTYTRLRLPSGLDNVDYEGDFVLGTIKGSGTEMVLKEGLYLVNAVIRFKQSSDDLTNTLSNVIIHTRDFDAPNVQEVGAIVRDETGPDASDDIHTITLTYIRHVSEDDVGSDRIKFAVETPNTWSECYIQNLQIAKLGSGGSSSEMTPYEAGDYISIENGIISVTGIDPDSYATQEDIDTSIQSATSGFITSDDLDGYATEEWVDNYTSAFITSADIPDIPDDVVTSAELAQVSGTIEQDLADVTSAITEALADKMDKSQSADFYPMASNPSGYLVGSDLNGYATENWVENYTSGFITSADLPDLTDYATKQYVENNFYSASNPSGFITSEDLPDVSDMATKTWVTDQNYITSADIPPIPEDVVTSGELATVSGEIVNQIPSLQGYATEQYVTDHTSAFITSADLPDVSDLATKTWVGEQGYLTSIPSEYVTDSELESAISGKADTSAIPDVSNFVTQEDIDRSVSGKMDSSEASAFYPMATNPSGYLVSSDLNGYATETYVQNYTSAFITSADIPTPIEYSAGANIDISENVISVSGTAGLIAGNNISITPSGDNYIISSSGSGGSVTFPLEVSGSTRVYEARDGLTSAYAEAGEIQVGYHDNEGEPDIDTVTITPYKVEVQGDWGGSYPNVTNISPQGLEIIDENGGGHYVDGYSIDYWNSASYDVRSSAAIWNSAASTQSDWNEADSASLAFIKNKPTINNVPPVTSSDNGKVLTASYAGGTGTYSWATGGGGGSTYYAGDHIVIDQSNYISTSGLMVENSAFMIDSAGYANRVTEGSPSGTLNVGVIDGSPLQVIGMQDDVEYTLNCSGNTAGVRIFENINGWGYGDAPLIYPTNDEIKFKKSDFTVVQANTNYYLLFNDTSMVWGNTATLTYEGSSGNTRYALVTDLPTSGELIPVGGSTGQVVTLTSSGAKWSDPAFKGIFNISTAVKPVSVEVVNSLPGSPVAGRIYLIPES